MNISKAKILTEAVLPCLPENKTTTLQTVAKRKTGRQARDFKQKNRSSSLVYFLNAVLCSRRKWWQYTCFATSAIVSNVLVSLQAHLGCAVVYSHVAPGWYTGAPWFVRSFKFKYGTSASGANSQFNGWKGMNVSTYSHQHRRVDTGWTLVEWCVHDLDMGGS